MMPAFRSMLHAALAFLLLAGGRPASGAVLLDRTVHLGLAGQPEWSTFEGRTPDATNLVLVFARPPDSPPNAEQTLLIRQDDVKQEWSVTLNGRRLGRLVQAEAPLVHVLAVPPGLLEEHGNRLEISGHPGDDILIQQIALEPAPKTELFARHSLAITVRERGHRGPFPCRITVLDARGQLAALDGFGSGKLAVRAGVAYTATGEARLGLLPGEYTIYATHGPEFGVASRKVRVPQTRNVRLTLRREVDTCGWIAADTHIHTFALSRHGDALLHERAITLAAEGLEMPVVTEHNLHTNYGAVPRGLGLDRYFTLVPGNEVTTKKGHFNIFPVRPGTQPPDHSIENWPDLFRQIRATPGVQIAILNHPTDVHSGFVPFASTNLNLVTGRNLRGDFRFPFDAMEVINSGAMNSDWMAPFRAWFALLNRGYGTVAVAGSDSHDVTRFIVGQGRTYVRGDDSNTGGIDVTAACQSLLGGHAAVSLGLFTGLEIRARHARQGAGPGELFSAPARQLELAATIAAPGWIQPRRATIYANGRVYAEKALDSQPGQPARISFRVPFERPARDTQFVLIAEGPGVTNLFWALARPYQPSSPKWTPVVIGATNPIRLDGDGDGRFTAPRGYTLELMALPLPELLSRLAACDWAIATQTAELLEDRGVDLRSSEVRSRLSPETRAAFDDYLASIPAR